MQKCRFSWTSHGGKRALRLFYCLEKHLSFVWKGCRQENNCIFEYVICGKRKRNQRAKIGDYVFLWNRRPHAKIELIWTSKKKYGLKSHLGYIMQTPFNSMGAWYKVVFQEIIQGAQRLPTMKTGVPSTLSFMQKVGISSLLKTKVSCLWVTHPGTAGSQLCVRENCQGLGLRLPPKPNATNVVFVCGWELHGGSA